MAISAVIDVSRLDDGNVLTPERYDPRRRYVDQSSTCLSDIVNFLREKTSAETADTTQQFVVFATGDARDGIIRPTTPPCDGAAIGSTKNRIRPGQVVISRLRPVPSTGCMDRWRSAGVYGGTCRTRVQFGVLCLGLERWGEHRFPRTIPAESSRAISIGSIARGWTSSQIQRANAEILAYPNSAT